MIIDPNSSAAFDYEVDDYPRINIDYGPVSVPHLEERIAAIASLREKPDTISGQRSSLTNLEQPFPTLQGFDVTAIQIKGHFFRDTEESLVIRPPQMLIYTGRGHPEGFWSLDDKGILRGVPNPDIPSGAIILEDAKLEYAAAKEMLNAGLPVIYPIAVGKFPDLSFCVKDSIMQRPDLFNEFAMLARSYYNMDYASARHDVGFLVHGLYNDNRRCFESVLDVCSALDNDLKKEFLVDFFSTYGRALRQIHDAGFIHGSPNMDNISLAPVTLARQGKKLPNRLTTFPAYEIVFHDITGDRGEFIRRKDNTPERWYAHIIWDLSNVTGLLANFYYSAAEWQDVFDATEEKRMSVSQRNHRVCEVVYETGYNPAADFFKGYLGKDFGQIPSGYFDHRDGFPKPTDLRMFITLAGDAATRMAGIDLVDVVTLSDHEPLMEVLKDVYL